MPLYYLVRQTSSTPTLHQPPTNVAMSQLYSPSRVAFGIHQITKTILELTSWDTAVRLLSVSSDFFQAGAPRVWFEIRELWQLFRLLFPMDQPLLLNNNQNVSPGLRCDLRGT